MDRDEALSLLRGGPEGIAEWNRRRGKTIPSFADADLREADLRFAELFDADLREADLDGANLGGAVLDVAGLGGANLAGADLCGASLSATYLGGANLRGADLRSAQLLGADLRGADLAEAVCGLTVFADVDLSGLENLDTVSHNYPCTLGTNTLILSRGKIPEAFLRGCGVPDALIAYLPALIGAMEPIQFYSVFISYSAKDTPIVERLYADLQAKGVRCWFAPEDLKIGERIRVGIDEAIRLHDKLLLVLSKNSVASDWVEKEVETAMEQERRQKRTVLFPVRLDESVMKAESGWAADIRRSRNIGDFRKWKEHDAYQKAFDLLLRDLKAEDAAVAKA